MLVSEAKTAIKRYGFDDNDPLNTALEAAKLEVEDSYNWPWLMKTATVNINSGVQTVSALLPVDLFKIYSVRDVTNKTWLTEKDMVGFERDFEDPSDTGKPEVYTINQQFPSDGQSQIGIQIYPVTDSAVTLRVLYQSTTNSIISMLDTAAMPGPSRLHPLYVMGAVYRLLQMDNEEDRATVAENQFNQLLLRVIGKYSSRVATARTVQDVQGYGH